MRSVCSALAGVTAFGIAAAGCITAPDVVIIDHKTALEQQAAGRFPELESDLLELGLQPGVERFTRAQLEAGGWGKAWGDLGALVQIYGGIRDDRAKLDDHLVRSCIGEGREGLLVATPDACQGASDEDEVASLVSRGNRHRRQAWRWMADRSPGRSSEELAAGWREVRLQEAPCGGWVQGADGAWASKECDPRS